jgi:hypothetical protein
MLLLFSLIMPHNVFQKLEEAQLFIAQIYAAATAADERLS